jgi:hypothetical protein
MTGAITLHPTGNRQGGYYFMSLITGHRLIRHHWTSLPMPKDVIDCVNALGHWSLAAQDLSFTWGDGMPILDLDDDEEDYDSVYVPSEPANKSNNNKSNDDLLSAVGVDDSTNLDEDEGADHDDEGNDNEPNSMHDNESNESNSASNSESDDDDSEGDKSDNHVNDNDNNVSDAPMVSDDHDNDNDD